MRPCQACGAAVQNNQQECPECGAPMPTRRTAGPPPETGPGVTGDPHEERVVMIRLLIMPVTLGVIVAILAVRQWGAWGIAAGFLAVFVAIMARLTMAKF